MTQAQTFWDNNSSHLVSLDPRLVAVSWWVVARAGNEPSRRLKLHNQRKGSYFSWLKVPTSAFNLKPLLRHYAKWVC